MAVRTSTGTWTATANSFNPAVTGTTIDAAAWNAILDEIEVEITDSVSRSGKGGMLSDLDMSNQNIINLASASAAHHAVRFDTLQDLSATLETRAGNLSASWAERDYVVLSAAGVLANERVLAAGTGLSANDAGAGGNFTLSLASVSASSVLGTLTAGTPTGLSQTQLTQLVEAFTGDSGAGGVKGSVPAPAAGDAAASKFLKADGTWTAIPGGGDMLSTDAGSAGSYWAASANRWMEPSATWEAGKFVALTDAATVSVNFSLGINFTVTLAGNRVLQNPTNAKEGQTGMIRISQSGGARTLTYGSAWKFQDGTAPTLSTALATASGAWDILNYAVMSSNFVIGSLMKNVK